MGLTNTQTIISELGEHNALAAKWCVQHGDGWYLPSVGEMQYLISVAKKGKEIMGICLGMQLLFERSREGRKQSLIPECDVPEFAFDSALLRIPRQAFGLK